MASREAIEKKQPFRGELATIVVVDIWGLYEAYSRDAVSYCAQPTSNMSPKPQICQIVLNLNLRFRV